ncbi:hypothetical protein PS928_05566 [Pseudomonas fluorescens]|uniref:Uncharacterized protein n=2 Tax=Pseudomonas fluorescens TaxID=294 RepID=A0A5E7VLY4_PSEFL|nr:hypothetical protein PS928_05566 [Pseudomonas fluorescens]
MGLDRLFEETRKRMGASREDRLKAARDRSEAFNRRATEDFAAQQMNRELLARTCSL